MQKSFPHLSKNSQLKMPQAAFFEFFSKVQNPYAFGLGGIAKKTTKSCEKATAGCENATAGCVKATAGCVKKFLGYVFAEKA